MSLALFKETGDFIDLHTDYLALHWKNQAMLKVRNFDRLVYHKVVSLATLEVNIPRTANTVRKNCAPRDLS